MGAAVAGLVGKALRTAGHSARFVMLYWKLRPEGAILFPMDQPESRKNRAPLPPLDTMRESLRDLQLGRWDDAHGFLARIDRLIDEAEQEIKERTTNLRDW
jgi:hypothetical protein